MGQARYQVRVGQTYCDFVRIDLSFYSRPFGHLYHFARVYLRDHIAWETVFFGLGTRICHHDLVTIYLLCRGTGLWIPDRHLDRVGRNRFGNSCFYRLGLDLNLFCYGNHPYCPSYYKSNHLST
ncbi:uncharacterized protein MELLADRAFT_91592 [Melampsora larici-populina 98AG31]|uniref:Uncharacterized protein n=1 Tax=Melampsora larici-populina (strain 98AG31 / pathotype 3-4-7) TaxID=747676 RepID=F4RZL4_MELLP|nr:uncharacterized protein MELLADRAFT_91592 [Melampsora larici-populina 98AG31]EGG02168.1 hypothetical protein MELLADRAFT_91592 [Melampsora larici-populina 98AG31]